MKCDECGRFTSHLNDVWASPPQNGIDRERCDRCHQLARPGRTKRAACGCDLSGMAPPAIHIVDQHEEEEEENDFTGDAMTHLAEVDHHESADWVKGYVSAIAWARDYLASKDTEKENER